MDYPGNDLLILTASSALDCQLQCYNNPQCLTFVFNVAALTCWLKYSYETNPTASVGQISGPRSCLGEIFRKFYEVAVKYESREILYKGKDQIA